MHLKGLGRLHPHELLLLGLIIPATGLVAVAIALLLLLLLLLLVGSTAVDDLVQPGGETAVGIRVAVCARDAVTHVDDEE